MMRVIVAPAVLPSAALAELKQWLGVTIAQDDAQLGALLHTAVDVCADFTGLLPLACTVEETLRAEVRPQGLVTRPVKGLVAVATLAADGTRTALDGGAYCWDITADGAAVIRLAAHHYRGRENPEASSSPPASVAALWGPWRRLRLA